MPRRLHIALLILLLAPALYAQERTDSLEIPPAAVQMDIDEGPEKTTLGAVLRSAVLPGWGQFYNESYWKVPVVLGITGVFVYAMIDQHQQFVEYSDLYDATITDEEPAGDLRLKRFREFYRDGRDENAWWLFVVYLIQLADAYVDAALFNFDVSDETSATVVPSAQGVSLQVRF